MPVVAYALTSLTAVKAYLGISVSTYDAILESLIDECTVWIENELGGRRIFNDEEDVTEYHDGDDGTGKNKIFPKRWPIVSITSLSYNSGTPGTPVWTAYTADDYELDKEAGIIYMGSALPRGIQCLKLVYEAGFADIPLDLSIACKKMVAKEFDKRKSQGVTQEGVGGGNVTWNENVDPSVSQVFKKYRRFF